MEHAKGSLAAVLVAPAGTNLRSGSELGPLDEDAYHDECRPYAEAGMAVVFYSIDGDWMMAHSLGALVSRPASRWVSRRPGQRRFM